MILYTFQNNDGITVDLPFDPDEVPSIGETVLVDDVPYRRLFCGRVGTGTIAMHSKYPYASSALSPASIRGAPIVTLPSGKKKVLIKSVKHEREIMARNGLVKEG